jgi:uncharacterized protein
MKNLPSWLLLAALSLLAVPAAADDLSPQKRADIERLLEMTGATKIGRQMAAMSAAHMAQSLRQSHPEIPQKALDILPEEVGALFEAHIGAFLAEIVPVYHRYFTAEEVKGMIGFYSTDLGRKAISAMPGLVSESMVIAQRWGQSLEPAIAERVRALLKKEGVDL